MPLSLLAIKGPLPSRMLFRIKKCFSLTCVTLVDLSASCPGERLLVTISAWFFPPTFQSRFLCWSDVSELSWITNPDPDHRKGRRALRSSPRRSSSYPGSTFLMEFKQAIFQIRLTRPFVPMTKKKLMLTSPWLLILSLALSLFLFSVPFNNMWTLILKAQPTNRFFGTVHQMFGGSSQLPIERVVISQIVEHS